MRTLRVHFDGHVFVPDEPVDLPTGRPLEIKVKELKGKTLGSEEKTRMEINPLTGLPVMRVPKGTKVITLEDVKHAQEEW